VARARHEQLLDRAIRPDWHHAFDLSRIPQQRRLRPLVGGAHALGPACLRHPQSGTRVHFADRGPGTPPTAADERTRLLPRAARAAQERRRDPRGKRIPRQRGGRHRICKPGRPNRASHGQADRHGPPRGHHRQHRLSHPRRAAGGARGATGRLRTHLGNAASLRLHAALATNGPYRLPVAALRAGSLHGLGNAAVHRADRLHLLRARRAVGGTGGPVRYEANDLALDSLCRVCEISLFEALGEPAPLPLRANDYNFS